MAQADTEVLRQFMVSLGFQVDAIQQRKFDTNIKKVDEAALRLGKTLLATGAAAHARRRRRGAPGGQRASP